MSTAKTGFGDETWALAQTGDATGLERAATLLLQDEIGVEYEGHRARAFALALGRRTAEALAELNAGWAEDWPTPDSYAIDVARIHFLAGTPAQALAALGLDTRTEARSQMQEVVKLVLICVSSNRTLWRRGLGLALANSTGLDRVLAPLRILNVWLRADGAAANP